MAFVTLEEAKAHIYVDHDDDDNLIQLYVDSASDIVQNYLKGWSPYQKGIKLGEEVDLESDAEPLPAVKASTLILIGILYRDRDGQDSAASGTTQWQLGYLPMPVQSLLYPLRDPACT